MERVIKELRTYLAMYTKEKHSEWHRTLPLAEFAFNKALHSSIGCSPFELNYGFEPKAPVALLQPALSSDYQRKKKQKRANAWLTKIGVHLEKAKAQVEKAHTKHAKQYNKAVSRIKDRDVFAPPGSYVLLDVQDLQNKETIEHKEGHNAEGELKRKFLPCSLGPYRVLEITGFGKLNRKLALPDSLKEKLKHDEFHIDRLKLAYIRDRHVDLSHLPSPFNGEEFFIEKIVDWKSKPKRGRYFKVRWEGFSEEHDKWIPEYHLEEARDRVEEFCKRKKIPLLEEKKKPSVAEPAAAARRSGRKKASVNLCLSYAKLCVTRSVTAFANLLIAKSGTGSVEAGGPGPPLKAGRGIANMTGEAFGYVN